MASSFVSRLGTSPEEGIKAPCVVSSDANITLSGEQTIATVAVVAGDRVLVRSQTDATENGIYNASTGAWSRANDWNNGDDVVNGVLITDATSNRIYQASFSGDFTPNTTSVSFAVTGVGEHDSTETPHVPGGDPGTISAALDTLDADLTTAEGDITATQGDVVDIGEGWFDRGDVPTYVSATSFTIPTDVTAFYHRGRMLRLSDSSTLYGIITASSYSAVTTVTVALVTGALSASLTAVDVAIIPVVNSPLANLEAPQWVWQAHTVAYASTVSFTIASTDVTASYTPNSIRGRRVRINDAGTLKFADILSATFSTDTTVVVDNLTLFDGTATTLSGGAINAVYLGLHEPGWSGSAINFFAPTAGEAGVVDTRWPIGDLRRYGAVGDGVADDTAAIQAAIDSGATAVYAHYGQYKMTTAPIIDGSDCKRIYTPFPSGRGSAAETTVFIQTGGAGNYALDVREAGVTVVNIDFQHSTEDPEILIYAKRNGAENEDVDLTLINCAFRDFTSAVKVVGRGCNIFDCVFQSGNVAIELDFDTTQLDNVATLGQEPDDAFRSVWIKGNRFHSIDQVCIQNNGAHANYILGMQIEGNHADQCLHFFQGSARHTNFVGNMLYACDGDPFYFIVGSPGSSTAVVKNVNIVGNVVMGWHTVALGAFPTFTKAAGVSDRPDRGILFDADVDVLNISGNTWGYFNQNAFKFTYEPATNVNIIGNTFLETNLEGTSYPVIDTAAGATVANANISNNNVQWTNPSTYFIGSSASFSNSKAIGNTFNTEPTTGYAPSGVDYINALAHGTWTPTITAITNVAATVAYICNYSRVGDIVTVSGALEIDPTATGSVQVELTLPIASNFGGFLDASGTVNSGTGAILGVVRADTTADKLEILANATTTANTLVHFTATYRVL